MAEVAGLSKLLDMIVGLVSPNSAEAKIVASPETMKILQDAMRADPTYKDVISYADKIPQVVNVREVPGLMKTFGAYGQYDKGPRNIYYDPAQDVQQSHETLSHELMHFLNAQSKSPVSTDAQHAIIQEMIGSAGMPRPASGLGPGQLTQDQQQIFNQWLGR